MKFPVSSQQLKVLLWLVIIGIDTFGHQSALLLQHKIQKELVYWTDTAKIQVVRLSLVSWLT